MRISPLAAYLLGVVFLYLWVVGGIGWKYVYEKNMDRTFTWQGAAIIILLWVPLTLVSAARDLIDAAHGRGEEE